LNLQKFQIGKGGWRVNIQIILFISGSLAKTGIISILGYKGEEKGNSWVNLENLEI
jgi:hypothetical protein